MALRIIFLSLFAVSSLCGQFDHIPIFEDLEDEDLRAALFENYKTQNVLNLSTTKDTLYKNIYLHKDSVRCVYSGFSMFLDLSEDPSQFLFGSGSSRNINLEHSYPQSKGAGSGPAQSDMHALFPSRVDINSARGSDPLAEIDDNQTLNWYFDDQTMNSIPQSRIDAYSEDNNSHFEPRENIKGNLARAFFYFYTMYRDEAIDADPGFFQNQLEDLCVWHSDDPVDSLEWLRTFRISEYQDGLPNPFVLDCSLARLYCSDIIAVCQRTGISENDEIDFFVYPNLLSPGDRITIESNQQTYNNIRFQYVDFAGKISNTNFIRLSDSSFEIEAPAVKGNSFKEKR